MTKLTLRGALTAVLLSAAAMLFLNGQSSAQEYAWCAVSNLGSEHCNYNTQAQCAASVSGNGGFCKMSAYAMSAFAAAPGRHRR